MGFFLSGRVSSEDQDLRSARFRDSVVSVSRSGGRFGSDFRLTVESKASSHFVFLEVSQLHWLVGVLRVAASSNWYVPGVCESVSDRCIIVVAKFLVKGVPTLKIIERCSNRKGFCEAAGALPENRLAFSSRSYAEATAFESFLWRAYVKSLVSLEKT
ncbi:hypothetical protein LINPERPRIM_LOCUS20030 [Linum perenne]